MKRDHRSMVMVLLLICTVIVFGWAILMATGGVTVLGMFHVAAPSSEAYKVMLRDVCADSQKLICMAVIPMAVMTVVWMIAFLRERRKSNNLKRPLRQQKDGDVP